MNLPRSAPRRIAIGLLALALLLYPLIDTANTYRQTVLIQIFLLAMMAGGWNIISGYTGYVSVGHSAFLGIGAYTVGILSTHIGVSPLLLAPLGGIAAALTAVILGAVIMRTRGYGFVIITIAFLFLMQAVGLNLRGFTGGSNGITLPLTSWSSDIQQLPFYYYLFALMALSVALSWWIRRSKFGTGLIAIREDEDKAAMIGVRTSVYKILSFTASAVLIGVGGGVWAYYLTVPPRYSSAIAGLSSMSFGSPARRIRPFSITTAVVAMARPSRTFCSTSTIVIPRSRIAPISSNTRPRLAGSSPSEGSSNSMILGSSMRHRANSTNLR